MNSTRAAPSMRFCWARSWAVEAESARCVIRADGRQWRGGIGGVSECGVLGAHAEESAFACCGVTGDKVSHWTGGYS